MTRNQILELFPIGPARFDLQRLHDPITAISGGVGAVGNIVGGILGNSAAKKAGALQSAAANQAASDVTAATAAANPAIGDAATRAGQMAVTAGAQGSDRATEAARLSAGGVSTAAGQANDILNPYQDAGAAASRTLQSGLATGGDFNKTPTMADIQIDPGYAFRLQQGQAALERSAAAHGGAISGTAAKSLNDYAQASGSQEYQNAFQRYNTTTQGRYDRLFGVSNAGQAAGTTQGNNLTAAARYGGDTNTNAAQFGSNLNVNAAQYSGTAGMSAADQMAANTIGTAKTAADYRTGGAAAQAAGIIGGANALSSGIAGGANAATGALSLNQLLKNPALTPVNFRLPAGTAAGVPGGIPQLAGGR